MIQRVVPIVFAALVSLSLAMTTLANALESPALSVAYRAGRGATVSFGGVPLVRATSLQVHAPGWTTGYYSSNSRPPEVSSDPATKTITVRHRADPEKAAFEATETIRLVGDARLEVSLAGTLSSDVEAQLEWCLGYLNAFPLYGGTYAAGDGAPATPVRPEPPAAAEDAAVVKGARSLRLDTRLGRIDVRVEDGPVGLTLLDGRRAPERWWTRETPTLFLGVLGATVKPREPFALKVSIEFTPEPEAPVAEPVTTRAAPTPVERAFVPQTRPIEVIPTPRKLEWVDGRFRLRPDTLIWIETPAARRAAEVLQREAAERFGWDWTITELLPPGDAAGVVRFASGGEEPANEGYEIRCDPAGLVATARSDRGHFYAAQTLVQLLQTDAEGAFVPACRIDDAPSLAFRGVHLFPGKDALAFHKRLIERVLARHKINHVVLESSYAQWDTDRGIWVDISVPKEQLAEYAKVLRDNFIEPIPLVQSLGHAEWMFKNGRNRDLAEDPETPYAYAVGNPGTYEFIGGVYAEALDVFEPRYFHIGHDEVTMRGRYPHRPASAGRSVTDLFLADVRWMHDFFRPRNVRVMLWGDMLLAPGEANDGATFAKTKEEAAARRAGVPTDAIVCDWHYSPAKPEAYTSLKVLRDAGFTTIACTWYTPENVKSFADAARLYGAWGLLQTTWAGYSITEQTVANDPKQFSAYLLAAEYAWSASSPAPTDLPWDADETFGRLMRDVPRELLSPRDGVQLDLAAAVTHALDADPLRLDGMPAQDWRFAGVAFRPAAGAVTLDGRLLPGGMRRASAATFPFDGTAVELCFLQATAFPAPQLEVVGTIEVAYADGSRETVPLRYGVNTRAWTDRGPAPEASLGFSGKSPDGLPTAVRVLRWVNPHPVRRIATVTFSTDHPYASPTLLGITALD